MMKRTVMPRFLSVKCSLGNKTYNPDTCCFCYIVSDSLQSHGLQHARLLYPSPSPGTCSNSCLLCQWCHPTISSSVSPFSSCPQSFLASGSFPVNQLFTSGGQCIWASASSSVLPVNIQGSFPLGLTSLISLLSKGLSRVFSSTTVGKYHLVMATNSYMFDLQAA